MNADRARKAQVVGVSGATTWAATFLPPIWAGAIGVLSATYLAWLVPKENDVGSVDVGDFAAVLDDHASRLDALGRWEPPEHPNP